MLCETHLNFRSPVMIDIKLKNAQRVSLFGGAADKEHFLWVDLLELDLDA